MPYLLVGGLDPPLLLVNFSCTHHVHILIVVLVALMLLVVDLFDGTTLSATIKIVRLYA